MSLFLSVFVSTTDAICAGSSQAGRSDLVLSDTYVVQLRDGDLAESAAPYLTSVIDTSRTALAVSRATFDDALEALQRRRSRLDRIRRVVSGVTAPSPEALARLAALHDVLDHYRLDDPPSDVAGLPRLIAWAHDLHSCVEGRSVPDWRTMEQGHRESPVGIFPAAPYEAWLSEDVVARIREDQAAQRTVAEDLVHHAGRPDQIERWQAGVLPADELLVLEVDYAFERLPTPAGARVATSESLRAWVGPPAERRALGHEIDARTWVLTQFLRQMVAQYTAPSAGRVQIVDYYRTTGPRGTVHSAVVQADGVLGHRVEREYAWSDTFPQDMVRSAVAPVEVVPDGRIDLGELLAEAEKRCTAKRAERPGEEVSLLVRWEVFVALVTYAQQLEAQARIVVDESRLWSTGGQIRRADAFRVLAEVVSRGFAPAPAPAPDPDRARE